MKHVLTGVAVFATAAIVNGCGLTGTWRTVSIMPEGERFPIVSVTFGEHRRFTATSEEDGRQRTSTGRYKWNGLRLVLDPGQGSRQTYRGYRRLDRSLVLLHRRDATKIKATLDRTGP